MKGPNWHLSPAHNWSGSRVWSSPVHIPDVLAPLLYSGGKWRHNFLFKFSFHGLSSESCHNVSFLAYS